VSAPTVADPCGYGAVVNGDVATCGFAGDGPQPVGLCAKYCVGHTDCYWYATSPRTLYCGSGCEGRRPAGLGGRVVRYVDDLAEYFARAAFLEAGSVDAFAILHRELLVYNAPKKLRAAALKAQADEVRHARLMGWLARKVGATPEKPMVAHLAPRSLLDMALENVQEGCVREAWGAVLAAHQAKRSTSAPVRRVLAVIAREEAEHAELGEAVARWLERKLPASGRRQVAAARNEAIATLRRELAAEPSSRLQSIAGFPDAATALFMFDAFFGVLAPLASTDARRTAPRARRPTAARRSA
jgi:hypothetical protein